MRNNYRHEITLQRITEDEDLVDVLRCRIDLLYLDRCDVFSLRQLKDILLPVNYLQRAILQQLPDITSMQPSIFIDLRGIAFVIPYHDTWPSQVNFALWEFVLHRVVHLWDVNELEFNCSCRAPNMIAVLAVMYAGDEGGCCALGLTISLYNRYTNRYL